MNKTADERIATLTAIVRMLERSRYGTRSERLRGATLSEEQHAFVFDEINTGMAAVEAESKHGSGQTKTCATSVERLRSSSGSESRLSLSLMFPQAARG